MPPQTKILTSKNKFKNYLFSFITFVLLISFQASICFFMYSVNKENYETKEISLTALSSNLSSITNEEDKFYQSLTFEEFETNLVFEVPENEPLKDSVLVHYFDNASNEFELVHTDSVVFKEGSIFYSLTSFEVIKHFPNYSLYYLFSLMSLMLVTVLHAINAGIIVRTFRNKKISGFKEAVFKKLTYDANIFTYKKFKLKTHFVATFLLSYLFILLPVSFYYYSLRDASLDFFGASPVVIISGLTLFYSIFALGITEFMLKHIVNNIFYKLCWGTNVNKVLSQEIPWEDEDTLKVLKLWFEKQNFDTEIIEILGPNFEGTVEELIKTSNSLEKDLT